jgi:hypothetical protein
MNDNLIRNSDLFFNSMAAFTRVLNEDPKPDSIKQFNGFDYLPIGYVEPDLRDVFSGMVKFNILNSRSVGNETEVTASITVFHPVAYEWFQFDGIGMDVDPSMAYAEAKKTAAKQIGPRYGSNLNRKEYGDYNPVSSEDIKLKEQGDIPPDVLKSVKRAKTLADLDLIFESAPDLKKNSKFLSLIISRKTYIKNNGK